MTVRVAYKQNEMILPDSAPVSYTGLGKTWANEMNFMNHDPGAGSIGRSVDLQSSSLPLCYRRYLVDYKHMCVIECVGECMGEFMGV